MIRYFDWDKKKNTKLIKERKVSFEIVVAYIQEGAVLDKVMHPNKTKYPNQKMYIIEIDEYVYVVPYIEDKEKIFLKTIIPSRKLTKNI
jgi:uncharacterized DUF497 family protein